VLLATNYCTSLSVIRLLIIMLSEKVFIITNYFMNPISTLTSYKDKHETA